MAVEKDACEGAIWRDVQSFGGAKFAVRHSESHVAAGPGAGFESKCRGMRASFDASNTATRAVVR